MTEWPDSLRGINQLPDHEKEAIYRTLLPEWLFHTFQIDPNTLTAEGKRVVHFRCPGGSRAVEIIVRRRADDLDPLLYLNMADTFNNQLQVLLIVVNNPDAPRYDIDIDPAGRNTHLATTGRNLAAEEAAMKAGLAPGQVRAGLRIFRQSLPQFETFVEHMGHNMYIVEPMAYHNAIIFERYGFSYMKGRREMVAIDQAFQPGGELHARLNEESVFRPPDAWRSVRGRSWAIHDGILGHPYTGVQMYKIVGQTFDVNTFPNGVW